MIYILGVVNSVIQLLGSLITAMNDDDLSPEDRDELRGAWRQELLGRNFFYFTDRDVRLITGK